ncbi:MAG: hypothetical protein IMF06_01560 [Proteobacteria bacterium]|nr:hypothetical protein [Pseudomonadota bacterium]
MHNTPAPLPSIMVAALMAAVGSAVFLTLPMLVGLVMNSLNFSEQEAGLIASSYFTTYLLSSLSSFFWITRGWGKGQRDIPTYGNSEDCNCLQPSTNQLEQQALP